MAFLGALGLLFLSFCVSIIIFGKTSGIIAFIFMIFFCICKECMQSTPQDKPKDFEPMNNENLGYCNRTFNKWGE